MKIVRYKAKDNVVKYGILSGEIINEISGDVFGKFKQLNTVHSLDKVLLLAPTDPTKVVAVGLNYKAHAKELNMPEPTEPLLFLKPNSSIIADSDNIVYPEMSHQVDYEGELGIIIKKRAKNIAQKDVKDYILGYTCVNDVTARDLQRKDVQFTRAKSFDTFCPIGPCIETELDPLNAPLKTYVNGKIKQNSNTNDMVFDAYYLVSFISKIMTLEAGDVITTGTPQGVGSIVHGDEVTVEIQGIGKLVNKVA